MFECDHQRNAMGIVRKYFQGLGEKHVALMKLYLSVCLKLQNQTKTKYERF